jgi:hypothetical protein
MQENIPPSPDNAVTLQELHDSLIELQGDKKVIVSELDSMKIRVESNALTVQEQLRALERSVLEIRDMARDAKHISVGVDGQNGLRGSIANLTRDVTSMTQDFNFLRQTAHNYNETKNLLLRLFVTSAVAVIIQFGGAVWFVSSLHSKQESIREDLNRVIRHIDKTYDEQGKTRLPVK